MGESAEPQAENNKQETVEKVSLELEDSEAKVLSNLLEGLLESDYLKNPPGFIDSMGQFNRGGSLSDSELDSKKETIRKILKKLGTR